MIRIICIEVDAGNAAHVGGPVEIKHKTFDVLLPEVDHWLREPKSLGWSYIGRTFMGIEILPALASSTAAPAGEESAR